METFDGEDDATVFRDVILLALLGFMVIVVLLLPAVLGGGLPSGRVVRA